MSSNQDKIRFQVRRLAKYLRWSFIFIALVFVLNLVRKDIVPSGKFSVTHNFIGHSPFITEIVPKQRVSLSEDGVVVQAEPVYSTLRFPRPFQTAIVHISFSNPSNRLIEFGPRILGHIESYRMKAIDHPEVNRIAQDPLWQQFKLGDLNLYQKASADYLFQSKDQFLATPPKQQDTAMYGVDWDVPYEPDIVAEAGARIELPLRGGHRFFIASKEDFVQFAINYRDLNTQEGPDTIKLSAYSWWGDEIISQFMSDDGSTKALSPASVERTIRIEFDRPEEQTVFVVEVEAGSDIVMEVIETTAPKLVADGHIHIAGGKDYRSISSYQITDFYRLHTSARAWRAQTTEQATLQKVRIGDEFLVLDEPLKSFAYTMSQDRRFLLKNGYPIEIEELNMLIEGRGVFAFDQNQYFTPYPWLLDHTASVEALDLDYILTDYEPPSEVSGRMRQSVPIDLRTVFAPDKALRVSFASPEFVDGEEFMLHDISVDYRTEPLTLSNFTSKFMRFFNREVLK